MSVAVPYTVERPCKQARLSSVSADVALCRHVALACPKGPKGQQVFAGGSRYWVLVAST